MCRRVALLLLALLIYAYPQFGSPDPPLNKALSLYQHADYLFHLTSSTPASDSAAVAGFEGAIRLLQPLPNSKVKDTLYPFSCLKKGILLDAGANYPRAIEAYRAAMGFRQQDDSLTFVAKVYAGAAYYNLNNFDSADYFLQKAESMASNYRNRDDEVRLYNTLGVLYYDNGNYQQGRNYFNQALQLVENKRPFDTISAVNLQTNIATCYYKLGLYDEALALYKKVLGYHRDIHFIYMNMGRTYSALGRYPEAMTSFRRVEATRVPAVLNEMAATQEQLHRPDSCAWYLDKFHQQSLTNVGKANTLDLGINQQYRADWLIDRQQYKEALASLQQSIGIFSGNNPANFTGAFAYFRLFDVLFKKAQVYELLYKTESKESWLEASWQAYTAALSLLRYIEKSYDTDDAKLFLKRKSSDVYDGALTVCLQLHRLHPDSAWLEQAFLISEKSKATIIFANLRENAFAGGEVGKELRNLKYNLARLNIRAEETTDSATMETIHREQTDYGIRLARLQKQLEQNSAYYRLKYDDSGPGLKQLQTQLSKEQALISFYVAARTVHTFVLTHQTLSYSSDDSVTRLQQDVGSWLGLLKMTENGRKFKAGALGDRLYQRLVKPIQAITPSQSEWIIVPDGFLYYLPFESLPGDAGVDFLLRTTTISYRFSSRLLTVENATSGGGGILSGGETGILSFAPFVNKGAPDFPRLPASREEIADLSGAQYTDTMATKTNFLKAVNRYPIVHLATHAVSSLTSAAGSFVAFYPSGTQKDQNGESNLYLEELYGLNLSATKLVIISACETGQGELAGKEGVISLGRAFAYAGCASTINSLWKADDKATAYILKRLYFYLEKGETKAKALQHAKLDYLSGDVLNKSPTYWAHLVLMGDESPLYGNGKMGTIKWVAAIILLSGAIVAVWWWKKRKKVGDF